jgi:hypothetical protein
MDVVNIYFDYVKYGRELWTASLEAWTSSSLMREQERTESQQSHQCDCGQDG